MALEIRNLVYAPNGADINCEYKHPQLGWIPFTANPSDVEPLGRQIFTAALAGEYGPIAPYVAPALGPDEIVAMLTAAVQAHLDATARTRGYDGILSLCSYATSTNARFAAEGQAGVAWRDAVWAGCYAIQAAVLAGQRGAPSADGLIAELPAMVWPAA